MTREQKEKSITGAKVRLSVGAGAVDEGFEDGFDEGWLVGSWVGRLEG